MQISKAGVISLFLTIFFSIASVSPVKNSRLSIAAPITNNHLSLGNRNKTKDSGLVSTRATILADAFSTHKKKKSPSFTHNNKKTGSINPNWKQKTGPNVIIEESSSEYQSTKTVPQGVSLSNKSKVRPETNRKTIVMDQDLKHKSKVKSQLLKSIGVHSDLEGDMVDVDEDTHLKIGPGRFSQNFQKTIMEQVTKKEDDEEFFNETLLNRNTYLKMKKDSRDTSQSQSSGKKSDQSDVYGQNNKNNNLTLDEELRLEEYIRGLKGDRVDQEFEKMTQIKKLSIIAQNKTSNLDMAMQGLVFTRFFFKKHHISKVVETSFSDYYYCSVHIDKTQDFLARYIFKESQHANHELSDQQRLAFRNARGSLNHLKDPRRKSKDPSKSKKKYLMKYSLLKRFEESYDAFTGLISKINFLFGQRIKERETVNLNLGVAIQSLSTTTGDTFERIIKKYYSEFRKIRLNAENYMGDLTVGLNEISCDIRDMMAFYHVLPRFSVVYKHMHQMLQMKEDPIVNYYRDRIVQLLYDWQFTTRKYMKIYSLFNFWVVYLSAIFEMPFDMVHNHQLRIVLVQRAVLEWLDASDNVIKYRGELKSIMSRYEKKYLKIVNVFEGLEDHIGIRIPFSIQSLEEMNSVGNIALTWIFVGSLIMFWKY